MRSRAVGSRLTHCLALPKTAQASAFSLAALPEGIQLRPTNRQYLLLLLHLLCLGGSRKSLIFSEFKQRAPANLPGEKCSGKQPAGVELLRHDESFLI